VTENVENLILDQLRLIREDFRRMDKRFDELEAKVDELGVRSQSTEGVLFGLGGYIRSIDERVEHIEQKLGLDA
jgi:tetrahydromethanopterin S-methyltransferase subunit G